MTNDVLERYGNLSFGTNIVIRFFDGTIIKGTIGSVKNDMISVNRVSVSFRQKNTQLKLSNLDLKLNTIESLIYCLPSSTQYSSLKSLAD